MHSINNFAQVYLCRHFVDFRKSINGLGAIIQEEMLFGLFSSSLFVFCCKRKKRIKILYWDKTGFALWYKKLEKDQFYWPKKLADKIVVITPQELEWLLDGVNITLVKSHQKINYQKLC